MWPKLGWWMPFITTCPVYSGGQLFPLMNASYSVFVYHPLKAILKDPVFKIFQKKPVIRHTPCITFILSHTCTPRQNGVSCNYVIFISRSEGQLCEEVWKTVWCLHEACKVLWEAWKPFFHTTSWCTVSCVWSQIQQRSSFNSYRTVVIDNITVLKMFYLCLYRSSVTMCM